MPHKVRIQRTHETYDTVHLATDEWASHQNGQIMQNVARAHFQQHHDCMFVEVVEHAGWWLVFRRANPTSDDPVICGTANDAAICEGPKPVKWSGVEIRRGS